MNVIHINCRKQTPWAQQVINVFVNLEYDTGSLCLLLKKTLR